MFAVIGHKKTNVLKKFLFVKRVGLKWLTRGRAVTIVVPGLGGSSCLLCQNLSHQLSEDRVLWSMFVLGSYRGRLRENVLAAKRPSGEGLVERFRCSY